MLKRSSTSGTAICPCCTRHEVASVAEPDERHQRHHPEQRAHPNAAAGVTQRRPQVVAPHQRQAREPGNDQTLPPRYRRAIEIETVNTVRDGIRQLQGFRKPVHIAGANSAATQAALEATQGTTVGVMERADCEALVSTTLALRLGF